MSDAPTFWIETEDDEMSRSSKRTIDAADAELAKIKKLVVAGDAYRQTLLLRPDGTLNGYPF